MHYNNTPNALSKAGMLCVRASPNKVGH